MRQEISASTVDGNVLAGVLLELFGDDVTSLIGICAGCGAAAPLAEAVVEIDESAAIVRCRTCTHTLLTVLSGGRGTRLVFGMLRELRTA